MALEREMDRLRNVPVFACLDDDALRLLAFSAEPRRVSVGDVLCRKGTPATGAMLVVSGTLELDDEHGTGAPTRRAGPGTLIDEAALLSSGPHQATATVTEAATVMTVPRASMLRAVEAYPDNAVALRRYWAARLGRKLGRLRASGRSS